MIHRGGSRAAAGDWAGVVVLALVLAAIGCSGSGGGAAVGTAKLTTSTSTTTTSTTVPQPTTTTTAAPNNLPLAAVLIPAPAGFAVSHVAAARNGPLDAAGFNKLNQSPTLAADLHFVDGYQASYDSTTGSDSIDVLLADFATASDATSFQSGFTPSDTTTSTDDPAIAGGDDFNSTKANPDGSFDHGVIATKGSRVMVIDYYTGSAAAVPVVATLAQQQYAKL